MIIVSSCLCGEKCRYNAKSSPHMQAYDLLRQGKVLPVCPEQLGGFSTPRPPAELFGGDGWSVLDKKACVRNQKGEDVTEGFVKGAEAVLRLCTLHGVKLAILKANSPSCGCGHIYDGSFSGLLVEGDGVTTALLKKHGIEIKTL